MGNCDFVNFNGENVDFTGVLSFICGQSRKISLDTM